MCGISGIIQDLESNSALYPRLQLMEKAQLHRGPDAQGIKEFSCKHWRIGLGHQRLSIIDLNDVSNQPMISNNGKYVLVYNGEVYNYKELRLELTSLGAQFQGESDTTIVMEAIRIWGPRKAFSRFIGMWAIAWLDLTEGKLILSRDRVGVKPLYYTQAQGQFYFASEIKTLLEGCQKRFALNHRLIHQYLAHSLLETTNETFLSEIYKLPAGHFAEMDLNSESLVCHPQRYWHIPLQNDSVFSHSNDQSNLIEEIRDLFFDAVKLRLRSDVPVGVALSGGVDSSSITAAMNSILTRHDNLNLISAVNDYQQFDESPFIDKVSTHIQRPVHKVLLRFKPQEIFKLFHDVTWHHDEPLGSFSTVAHYLLMRRAKEIGVTVILSGQGADEILCGYKKYLGFYLQYLYRKGDFSEALKTLADFYKQKTVISQFNFSEAKRYLPNVREIFAKNILGKHLEGYDNIDLGLPKSATVQERQAEDVYRFSIPILTHYEDRTSMAFAREIRLPFLDHRLIEKLVPLDMKYKLHDGWTKWIFRKAMEPYLPAEITWRKDKQGFINPQSEWLKHELQPQVLSLFEKKAMIFQRKLVKRNTLLSLYNKYCDQPVDKGWISFKDIFNPLALEIWLQTFHPYISV